MTDEIARPLSTEPLTDHRQSTRNAVSWRARVSTNGATFFDCRTFDISLGGVGLLSEQPLAHGVEVLVALQVPPNGVTAGRVVTSRARAMFQILSGREYRIGMQWSAPDDPALALLGAWSARRG